MFLQSAEFPEDPKLRHIGPHCTLGPANPNRSFFFGDSQLKIQAGHCSADQSYGFGFGKRESIFARNHVIVALDGKSSDNKVAGSIGFDHVLDSSSSVGDCDLRMHHGSTTRIQHGAPDDGGVGSLSTEGKNAKKEKKGMPSAECQEKFA